MCRNMLIIGAVLFPFIIFAQTVKNEMDHGNSDITWRIYETEGPVAAFAITKTNIWYSLGTTVGAYNRKTNKKRAYPMLGSIPSAGVKAIASESNGKVWFGGPEGAAVHSNGKFKIFTTKNGLSDNAVNTIYCGGGSVWVGTQKGVSLFRGGSWKSFGTADGLCGEKVRGIVADDKGTVWFATNKGVAAYKGGAWKKHDASSGLSWNDAHAIAYDERKGVLWVAVGEQDVNNYNYKEWNTYMDIQMGIKSILVDTQSRIWFGSMAGVLKYNGFEWVTDPAKIGFPAAQVTDMERDNIGDLYFALEMGILHMKNPYPY